MTSGIAELCFVASKHAIQAALAMEGKGYSSKMSLLLPLAEEYLGGEIAAVFRGSFALYAKPEYALESLTRKEAKLAIEYATKIMEVYHLDMGRATSNIGSNTSRRAS